MKSFHGDEKLKARLLKEIGKHEKADAIIQGTYGEEQGGKWRGCAVGCALKSMNTILGTDDSTSDHTRYEDELGIPWVLAHLEDRIFEGLTPDEAKAWPRRFIEAVPVGKDLSLVWPRLAAWLMDEVMSHAPVKKNEAVMKACADVRDAYLEVASGKEVSRGRWIQLLAASAASAASAAASAAYAASASASAASAASAAASAAYAASAASAAYAYASAASASAASAARHKFYSKMADKLVEMIQA